MAWLEILPVRPSSSSSMLALRRQAGQTGILGNTTLPHSRQRLPRRQGVRPGSDGMRRSVGLRRFTTTSPDSDTQVFLQLAKARAEDTRHELRTFLFLARLGFEL